jgi:CheY-like chemotaxis protein
MDETAKNGATLLVVDDEVGIREVLCLALAAGGHECITAADGREAINVFLEHESEICGVITDLKMPEMDGFELVRRLRETRADLPIVVSSGSITEEQRQVLAELNVHDVLLKPYTARQLLDAIEPIVQPNPCIAAG